MRFQQFTLSALLFGSAALATQLNERFSDGINPLTKRQQFVPTTTTAQGETCADAFGAGYVTCREKTDTQNRLCYNPDISQTCCSNSWACPSGSFCLVSPYCCPNGQDPKTCAAANGVSLSSDFMTATGSSPLSTPYPAGNHTVAGANTTGTKTSSTPYYTGVNNAAAVGHNVQVGIAGALIAGAAALL